MEGIRGLLSGFLCLLLVSVLSLLGLAITLNLTVLNPDFVVAELKQLDIYSLLAGQVESFLVGEGIPEDTARAGLSGLEQGLEQEIEHTVRLLYGAMERGETGTAIYLSEMKSVLKDYVAKTVASSPELQGALASDMEAVISKIYSEIDGMVPETISLSNAIPGVGTIPQLNLISQIPGYLRTAYRVLVVLAVVLIVFVCLVHWWQPKAIVRAIGAVFITVGAGCVITSLFGSLGDVLLGFFPVPSGAYSRLQSSLLQLFNETLKPMRLYGFGFLGAGTCLLILSMLWRTAPTASRAVSSQGGGLA